MTIPPFLTRGARIAITCPAGYMDFANAEKCIQMLQAEGYEVVTGNTLKSTSENYFSGDDDARRAELQGFLDDKSINTILCGRGGYGTSRIVDDLDFSKFLKRPKWIIGFSDITVLHAHIFSRYKIAGLHAPMAAAFKDGLNDFNKTLFDALRGNSTAYHISAHALNRSGKAKGKLVGGNLALLAHLCGTKSDINTKNCILFLEDIGEYLYNADRMLLQLKRAGKFNKLKGLIFGGFSDMKDTQRPFGKSINDILSEAVKTFDFPVAFDFPVSHTERNVALKVGVQHELIVSADGVKLSERL